jgi:hypothetical protein
LRALHLGGHSRKCSSKAYFKSLRGFLRLLENSLFLDEESKRPPFSVKIALLGEEDTPPLKLPRRLHIVSFLGRRLPFL